MSKNSGKNLRKNVSGKYSQTLFDHSKKTATDARKTTSKEAIQKTAEVTGYFWLVVKSLIKLQRIHHKNSKIEEKSMELPTCRKR